MKPFTITKRTASNKLSHNWWLCIFCTILYSWCELLNCRRLRGRRLKFFSSGLASLLKHTQRRAENTHYVKKITVSLPALALKKHPLFHNKSDFWKKSQLPRIASFCRTIFIWSSFDRFLTTLFEKTKICEKTVFFAY